MFGGQGGSVLTALAYHQSGLGSNPRLSVEIGTSLLFSSFFRIFFMRFVGFPPSTKKHFKFTFDVAERIFHDKFTRTLAGFREHFSLFVRSFLRLFVRFLVRPSFCPSVHSLARLFVCKSIRSNKRSWLFVRSFIRPSARS